MQCSCLTDGDISGAIGIGIKESTYSLSDSRISFPSLSRSSLFLLGLIALASSGGYSGLVFCIVASLGTMMEDDLTRSPSLGRSMRERRRGPSDSEADEEAEECDESGDTLDLGCEIETSCGGGDVICEWVVPTMFSVVAARDLVKEIEVNVQFAVIFAWYRVL